jgi:hypothetical protein
MPQNAPQPEWAGDAPQTAERRDWIRFTPRCMEVTWQFFGSGMEWLPANVQDLSCRGIGLVVPRPVQSGAVLSVRLNPYDLRQKAVLVRIKHVAALPGGQHQVGGTFVVPLSPEEVRSLVGRG